MAAAESDGGRKYDSMVKQFGQAVMREDWAAAYAMTTPAFQADVPLAQFQEGYQRLIAEIRQDDPNFKPNMVDSDYGSLPSNEQEAQKYGIRTVPPKSTWRAWSCASIGEGDANGIERGIDAWLLITEESGTAKIAHAEFMFAD